VLIGGYDRVVDILQQTGVVAELLLGSLALGYVPVVDR
jgi:hypothetical protein